MKYTVVLITVLSAALIELTVQTSCFDGQGKPYCDKSKCQKVDCKGNIGKDMCECCDVCLKQEGEICGGQDWHLGRCDHQVPHCIKLSEDSKIRQCATLKKATELGLLLKERQSCKVKDSNSEINAKMINCYLKVTGPTYWCKKTAKFNNDDCCVHTNRCNPDEDIYEEVKTDLDLSALGATYREEKKRQIKFNRSLAAASMKILRMKMRKMRKQIRIS